MCGKACMQMGLHGVTHMLVSALTGHRDLEYSNRCRLRNGRSGYRGNLPCTLHCWDLGWLASSHPPSTPLLRYLHPATREWKEGLMSVTFRDMANNKINKHQWIGGC
jgi:hypothetical protein